MTGNSILHGKNRQEYAVLFAQHLLGALDFAHDPFRYEFHKIPMVEETATFMSTYFNELDPEKALWFQAIEWEE
jgi:hypothetical protein